MRTFNCKDDEILTSSGCRPFRGTDTEGRPVSVRIEDDSSRLVPAIKTKSTLPDKNNGTFNVTEWIMQNGGGGQTREDCWSLCDMLNQDHCTSDQYNGFASCSCGCCYAYYSWTNNISDYTFYSWMEDGELQVGNWTVQDVESFNTFNQTICNCGGCHYAYNECLQWCNGQPGHGDHTAEIQPGEW